MANFGLTLLPEILVLPCLDFKETRCRKRFPVFPSRLIVPYDRADRGRDLARRPLFHCRPLPYMEDYFP